MHVHACVHVAYYVQLWIFILPYFINYLLLSCDEKSHKKELIAGVNTNTLDIQTPDTVANLIGGLPKPGTAPVTNNTCN